MIGPADSMTLAESLGLNEGVGELGLQPLLHARHNNGPVWQQNDEEQILDWSFNRVRKANEPERNRRCSKFLSFQCAYRFMIKGRHEIGSDLGGFLLGYCIGRVLIASLKDIFERAAVLGRASIPEQFDCKGWGRQHKNDCEDGEAHASPQQQTSGPVNRLVQLPKDRPVVNVLFRF